MKQPFLTSISMAKKIFCKPTFFGGCRRKLVGSLPWGISTVVVYRQTSTQATNLMWSKTQTRFLSRFGRRVGVILTSCVWLYWIVLSWDELICPLGDLCPSLYILKGQSYKQSILFGTISCSLAVHADQHRAPHVFILWAEPPLMVRPMSTYEGIGGLYPHS